MIRSLFITQITKHYYYRRSYSLQTLRSKVSPAVDCNRSVLAKLLLCFLHVPNEFYEAFTGTWNSLLWPVCELELSYCS